MPALLKINGGREYSDKTNISLGVHEELHERVEKIRRELAQGVVKPFRDIIEANVGDSSVEGGKQITFIRQVTALACLPDLLLDSAFPEDVKHRARSLLQQCRGNSIGSLTDIEGLEMVRRHIADYIRHRDSCPSNWEDIIIVPGVSAAVKILYKLMNYTANRDTLAVLTPVPEFPLFSSALSQFGIEKVPYYLDEEDNWSVDVDGLQHVLAETSNSCLRAILVINPGNPTGQVLTTQNMEEIVKFANRNDLLIIACEVYQDNVYRGTFNSFKKVVYQLGSPYNRTELISLMSSPKGYADTGMRAGYMELYNINSSIKQLLRSSIQIADSPPICAQIALDCVACPPTPGQPSYSLFHQERWSALESLKTRANLVSDVINSTPGLSCNALQGGFFAFIKVDVPDYFLEKANSLGRCPSALYCQEMLEHVGVVTNPGEVFGQKPGSLHFRISILLPQEVLTDALQRIQNFHLNLMKHFN
ncbi:alanine aminotransferase 2-like isoform X2 [Macrosteles quadrilineatus]|nr:alanine aminotransferase 2-like isoform X2 [Macrosteles quadrilineatus]XP_054288236.1 alanine aminotransferase 2-like isoform X2 [Macrosteles quadrilineatus]